MINSVGLAMTDDLVITTTAIGMAVAIITGNFHVINTPTIILILFVLPSSYRHKRHDDHQ